tara:strand:- start:1318 stop:2352 length:1035 start_codon:yes stop_codon:yes gene_type:complete
MNGCVLFNIFFPGHIRVLPGEEFFELDNMTFCVGIAGHQSSVATASFPNEIVQQPQGYTFNNPITALKNQTCNYRRLKDNSLDVSLLMSTENGVSNFSYSDSMTLVRVAFEANYLELGMEKLAIKALNHFIKVYRYASKDMNVKETEFIYGFKPYLVGAYKNYREDEKAKPTAKQRIQGLFDNWEPKPTHFISMQGRNLLDEEIDGFDRNKVTGEIAHYLTSDSFYPWMQTMNRAYELASELKHNNAAIIEAFLSVEVRLFEFVRKHGLKVKFNRQYKQEPTIVDVIRSLKRLLSRELYQSLDNFRISRNKIVHESQNHSYEECIVFLNTATQIHRFIEDYPNN